MIRKREDCIIWKELDHIERNTQCALPWGLTGIVLINGSLEDIIRGGESKILNHQTLFSKKKNDYYELYCVNTDSFFQIRFGTSVNPIEYMDDEYNVKVRIRTFGETDCRIENPQLFFRKFIVENQEKDLSEENINEYLNKKFSILFSQILRECIEKEEKKTRNQFDSRIFLEKLIEEFQYTLNHTYNKEYGIYVRNININDLVFSGYELIEQRIKIEQENQLIEEQMKTIDILKRKKQ